MEAYDPGIQYEPEGIDDGDPNALQVLACPIRRQVQGPRPTPRWLPLPQGLSVQIVKQHRRRHLGGVKRRVVLGTRKAIAQVLSVCGWKSNTALVERLNLDIRQRVAAAGRRV